MAFVAFSSLPMAVGSQSLILGTKAALVHGWRRDPAAALERITHIAADAKLRRLPIILSFLQVIAS